MSLRNTLIVLALLVVVGGYALYLNHQPPPNTNPKVFALDAKDIKKIELKSSDRDIVLERSGNDKWLITKPVHARAEAANVDSIAGQIANLEITGTADDHPTDLAPFGLAVPAVTVTVTTNDNKVLSPILVGKQAPIGNAGFIKIADRPAVVMVAPSFAADVNRHVNDLRSHSLFTALNPLDADRIVIRRGSGELELSRAGGGWKIIEPHDYPADTEAVLKLLRLLDNVRLTEFVDQSNPDLTKYGLNSPSLAITLYSPGNKDGQTVYFGYVEPKAGSNAVYSRTGTGTDDPVYTVTKDVFASANVNYDDLRDKTVLRFDPANVSRVTIAGGPINETLQRNGKDKWTVSSDGKSAPAEPPVVTSLFDQLRGLTAVQIVQDNMSDPQRFGMVAPTVTIAMFDKDNKPVGELRTSMLEMTAKPHNSDQKPQTSHLAYATTNVDSTVYQIQPQAVQDLENTANRLHSSVTPAEARSPSSKTASHNASISSPDASPSR